MRWCRRSDLRLGRRMAMRRQYRRLRSVLTTKARPAPSRASNRPSSSSQSTSTTKTTKATGMRSMTSRPTAGRRTSRSSSLSSGMPRQSRLLLLRPTVPCTTLHLSIIRHNFSPIAMLAISLCLHQMATTQLSRRPRQGLLARAQSRDGRTRLMRRTAPLDASSLARSEPLRHRLLSAPQASSLTRTNTRSSEPPSVASSPYKLSRPRAAEAPAQGKGSVHIIPSSSHLTFTSVALEPHTSFVRRLVVRRSPAAR